MSAPKWARSLAWTAVLGLAAAVWAPPSLANGECDPETEHSCTIVFHEQNTSSSGFNPCNGEEYTLYGTFHLVLHRNFDNGARYHRIESFRYALRGVGSFGTHYVLSAGTANLENSVVETGNGVYHTTAQDLVIAEGDQKNNFYLFYVFHMTISSDGETVVFLDNLSTECRG